MAGEINEQLDHQVELGETLRQIFFVGLILLEVVVQSLKNDAELASDILKQEWVTGRGEQ